MQRSFTYNGATITLHRRRNADQLDAELIVALLTNDVDRNNLRGFTRRWHRAKTFAVMLASIDSVEGDPGFPIPSPDDTEADLRAGFDAWLNENGFYDAWLVALNAVNAPVGDPDTAPGVDADPNS